ncbi:hypothetical protein RZS08_00725, partial [Arthrospira platensis SPKY1]|nr:hypothetical protein [Arthrospira platensis SPKY1]
VIVGAATACAAPAKGAVNRAAAPALSRFKKCFRVMLLAITDFLMFELCFGERLMAGKVLGGVDKMKGILGAVSVAHAAKAADSPRADAKKWLGADIK